MPTIVEVDQLEQAAFVALLGKIFEHSPWVALEAWPHRPFGSVRRLHEAMADRVRQATRDRQLALIRAHPDLAGKAALAGELTRESSQEQQSAGLDQLNPEEFQAFRRLNGAYRGKFGFPFVMAVRGAGKAAILAGFERRLPNAPEVEFAMAIEEIVKIGWFRLSDLLAD